MSFTCKACSKTCRNDGDVYNHARRCPSGVMCPKCGQSLTTPQSLRRHMQQHHKDHPCASCGRGFFLQTGLKSHQRSKGHSQSVPMRPTSQEMDSLGETVNQVVRFLHEFDCSFPGRDYRVSKVFKSGSLSKGTAVQKNVDVDLVMHMQGFKDTESFLSKLPQILRDLKTYVQNKCHGKFTAVSKNKYMVKCKFNNGGTLHDVDILPARDLLSNDATGMERRALYEEMGRQRGSAWEGPQSHYSVCLAELQRDFVKSKTDGDSRIKDLIVFVKQWSKNKGLPIASYSLELVCIKVCQEGGGYSNFEMTRLVRFVMEKLSDMSSLRVNFNDDYNSGTYSSQWSIPFVMDPVNPHNNTLPRDVGDRQRVASAAAETL